MNDPIRVQIIGSLVACASGYRDAWRETARWAARRLEMLYGDAVRVEYYDLFDLACPTLTAEVELPVVLVDGEILSHGQRISIPLLRKRLGELMQKAES